MSQIPSTTKDNNADYYDESHKDAQHNSNTNGSCNRYIITTVNWSLQKTTCTIHMKTYKYRIHTIRLCVQYSYFCCLIPQTVANDIITTVAHVSL